MKKNSNGKIFLIIIFILIIGIGGYIFYNKKKEESRIAKIK